jgi:flagellar basal-body rod modification protein FlgD
MATDLLATNQSSAAASLSTIQDTSTSAAQTSVQRLSDDFDNFLTLLTTQLKNQDPTEPVDANEFTRQLVDFTGVEQAIATNENLEKLIQMQNESQLTAAVGYVGGEVTAHGNASRMTDSVAEFTYSLDEDAAQVTILITDAAGRAVFSGQGATDAGRNVVIWDGVNSFNGGQEADGTYYINVAARDNAGELIDSMTYTTGVVTGATIQDGEVLLEVAGTGVPMAEVVSLRLPDETGTDIADGTEDGSDAEDGDV